jgi:Tetratricopeptide repeat
VTSIVAARREQGPCLRRTRSGGCPPTCGCAVPVAGSPAVTTPDTLTTRNNVAYLTGAAGDAAGALRLYREVRRASERVLGPTIAPRESREMTCNTGSRSRRGDRSYCLLSSIVAVASISSGVRC